VLMRNALSKSTLNFLVDANFLGTSINLNWKEFFQPVVNPHAKAKQLLQERMAQVGVVSSPNFIPGDGNCQMHSLSDQLCGNLNHHVHIRTRIVNWLKSNSNVVLPNGATLSQFVNEDWNSYCNSMLNFGTWGDHLTLIAAAELFSLKIVIISSAPGDNFLIEILPTFSNEIKNTIYLTHLAEFHYSSVFPKY